MGKVIRPGSNPRVTTSFRENYIVKGDYTAFADVQGGDFTIPKPELVKAKWSRS